jgi:hypothetical protein
MENAVSGPENTQRTFPARPTRCHKCKFRNIPGSTITNRTLRGPLRPRCCHPRSSAPCAAPTLAPIVAESKRPFPEFDRRESNLFSRATKSRDPDFATWLPLLHFRCL